MRRFADITAALLIAWAPAVGATPAVPATPAVSVTPGVTATPAVPAAAQAKVERLPSDVRPSFQFIALDLDPAQKEYRGTTRIELTVGAPQAALRFHAQRMTLKRVLLARKGAAPMELRTEETDEGLIRATRATGAPIPAGPATLEIEFENDFDQRATSLYRLQVEGRWYAFTQFEPADARAAFPCFDEPSFKFPYQFKITVPASVEAVTNTSVERDVTSKGKRTILYRRTLPLPSYLLAISVGPFEYKTITGTSIPTRIVTAKGKSELAATAAAMVPPILKALETYFGRRYPFDKLDLIAVPEYTYGAMENPGSITYSDQYLLFDPKSMSVYQRRTLARFTAHELAHMWFGDLVTMKWWDDLWLNESFAEWMGDKIAAEVYPELGMDVSSLDDTQHAYEEDSRLTSRAIRQPVETVENLLENADALTYQKGQAVLGMMEQWLGPATFRRGVLAFLREHAWGNAVEADLWRSLSKASGRDVAAVGATFFDQPGIPLVRGELLANGKLTLRQSRFLNFGLRDSVPRSWRIPVSMRYPSPRGVRTWSTLLTSDAATVALPGLTGPPAWIQLNAEETGYYRWQIEGPAMAHLADQATNVLSARERYGFLLNAYALLKGGSLPGDQYMKLLVGFGNDPNPDVVNAVAGGIGAIHFYFITQDLEDAFAEYVRSTLGPALERIGLEAKPGESPATSSLRASLFSSLADEGKDPALRSDARKIVDRYLAGDPVDPSMLGSVLRVAAFEGDAALFDAYQARFEKGTVPSERTRLLMGLGSFRAPDLRRRALAYNLSGPLKPQEHFTIIQGIGSVPEQQDEAWEWARAHYDEVSKLLPPFYLIYFPHMASGCSAQRLEAARVFFADASHSPPGTETELKKVEATVTDCIGIRDREGPSVRAFLRNRVAKR